MQREEQIEESIFPVQRIVYAKFSSRLVAAIVDGVFVFLAWFMLELFFKEGYIKLGLEGLIVLLYYPLMEGGGRQATLGKISMNIRVADLRGNRISMGQAFIRHVCRVASAAILLAGYFMMLWDERRQTLHDRIASTIVIAEDGANERATK